MRIKFEKDQQSLINKSKTDYTVTHRGYLLNSSELTHKRHSICWKLAVGMFRHCPSTVTQKPPKTEAQITPTLLVAVMPANRRFPSQTHAATPFADQLSLFLCILSADPLSFSHLFFCSSIT